MEKMNLKQEISTTALSYNLTLLPAEIGLPSTKIGLFPSELK